MTTRVLIIEDDRDVAGLLSDLFMLEGWETTTAADGVAAGDMIGLMPFDLIVLDIMLPGGSGLDALAQLRAQPRTKRTPVIVVSACADEGIIWDTLRSGADCFVNKPFEPTEVSEIARRLLHRSPVMPYLPSAV